jgi:olfactory receptor
VFLRPAVTLPIDKAVAVFYKIITPKLNPLIYTLRNHQMKNSISKVLSRKDFSGNK